jgi:hypothetical protein
LRILFDFQRHRTYVHCSKRQRRHLALDLGSVKASFKKGPGLDLRSLLNQTAQFARVVLRHRFGASRIFARAGL